MGTPPLCRGDRINRKIRLEQSDRDSRGESRLAGPVGLIDAVVYTGLTDLEHKNIIVTVVASGADDPVE